MPGSTSTSYQYDLTSGQDAAHKLAQERSALEAGQFAALYGGDIPSAFTSENRIRDIKKYLDRGGYDADMEIIPRSRLSSIATSSSSQHV